MQIQSITLNNKIHVSQFENSLLRPVIVSFKASPSPLQLITVNEPTEEHRQI